MLTEFKLPELGENITAGTAVKIAVTNGDSIEKDQTLIELETDKASIEVPSPLAGVIKEIYIHEGDEVQVGQTVMIIEATNGKAPQPSKPQPATEEKPKTETPPAKTKAAKPTAPQQPAQPVVSTSSRSAKDVPAAPSVRRFAREIGIDITQVPGTGKGGRISIQDVKAYSKQLNAGGSGGSAASGVVQQPLPDFSKFGQVERQAMNNIRKKTAQHLSYAWSTIPHVTQFDKADITELEKLRKRYSKPDRKLTITPFLLKVMAAALKAFPQFNTSIDMANNEIIYKKYYHLGVAVDTDRGLLVPVVRDVDQKSIFDLADELNAIAERARNKKTSLDELQGGCFTLTNLGGIGGTCFTPIVNWPEVSILGVSRAQMEPTYSAGQFTPRLMLPLSLSYDHRVIDGADGARFLRWIADAIQQPFLMDLEN